MLSDKTILVIKTICDNIAVLADDQISFIIIQIIVARLFNDDEFIKNIYEQSIENNKYWQLKLSETKNEQNN